MAPLTVTNNNTQHCTVHKHKPQFSTLLCHVRLHTCFYFLTMMLSLHGTYTDIDFTALKGV